MPRKSIWPPAIQLHKPSGQDRIRVNGRDYYLGPHGSEESHTEYARLVTELAAQGRAGPTRRREAATAFTVDELLVCWWRYAERTYSERGRELHQFRAALQPLERLYGLLP